MKLSDIFRSRHTLLLVAIFLWIVGLSILCGKVYSTFYRWLYCAPAITWLSSEMVSLMMSEKHHKELKGAIIVNTHIAAGLWFLNTSETTISSIFFSIGCFLAIIWRGGEES